MVAPRGGAVRWQGRASDFRRDQVRARGQWPAEVDVRRDPGSTARTREPASEEMVSMEALWRSFVDVLDAVEAPTYALLSTESGFPLRAHGYGARDLVAAVRAAGSTFDRRRADATVEGDVATLEVVSGVTQTVIATISSPRGRHLLAVTADEVSMPVLRAWTHHTATRFASILARADAPR
ncbi:hypothetical protein L2K70_18885 [Nocardioides KLBMP 9356]|uniref:Roadblock/LAMTOR2 domain-containing protein n=1 Tax=Nocardioides potassii TaxID=2911371 RepID=A0ABS9HET3_9ACTN|nr:hypothetical protein [Nocardioides potassii]MCF6379682.1 hypothetical protein [Nocardioides potassii]